MSELELESPCKVNLVLNILGRREDGYHELESLMVPVPIHDRLRFELGGVGIQLTCTDPGLPVDENNLVFRAARAFFDRAGMSPSVRIKLEKNIPREAGMGGGSGNAAVTLRGLNQMHDRPMNEEALWEIAASLGSDIPFFLQPDPALCFGRGEIIQPIGPLSVLQGKYLAVIHPGFGVSTGWAYRQLARFEESLQGTRGRAERLADRMRHGEEESLEELFNSFEAPVFEKFPVLALIGDFFVSQGAVAALMAGSGSAVFTIVSDRLQGETLCRKVLERYGARMWHAVVPLAPCE